MDLQYTDDRTHLQVEIRSKHFELPRDELARLQARVSDLGDMPAGARLALNVIRYPRSQDYHAEAKLKLPGRTLMTGRRHDYLDSAVLGCLDQLRQEIGAAPMRDTGDRQAALDHDIVAPESSDAGPLAAAATAQDYRAFRVALANYEEWLRKRVGRWIQRYPEVEERIGADILIGDLLEQVYLSAFEQFERRPIDLRISAWLDKLIDPVVRAALKKPDAVREEASLARTVRDAPIR